MGYIYKLIDELEYQFAKENKISFSRPIFSFIKSEGFIINFAKGIRARYLVKKKIYPRKKDLEEIKKWVDAYRKSYGKIKDDDIVSDAMVIFCGIISAYCGYFTNENLDDEETRKKYILQNKLKGKIAYIRINDCDYNHLHWRSNLNNFIFDKCLEEDGEFRNLNGFLHPIDVEYSCSYNDYFTILSKFNGEQLRDCKYWFSILSNEFAWQNEKRLIFALESLKPNSATVGCDSVYKIGKFPLTLEERIFQKIVDAIDYCEKSPDHVYLSLNPGCIEIFNI